MSHSNSNSVPSSPAQSSPVTSAKALFAVEVTSTYHESRTLNISFSLLGCQERQGLAQDVSLLLKARSYLPHSHQTAETDLLAVGFITRPRTDRQRKKTKGTEALRPSTLSSLARVQWLMLFVVKSHVCSSRGPGGLGSPLHCDLSADVC